jgi:Holliday junction resolvase RusA-like endonuclease
MTLRFTVLGTPAPQGSKKGFVVNGRAVIVDDNKKPLTTWRGDVKETAAAAVGGRLPLQGPVEVTIAFRVPRPAYHFGTGRNAGVLKPTAPTYVDKKPDLDKYERATLDALTAAGVYGDDGQVARLMTEKVYATHPDLPGADITVAPIFEAHTVGRVGDDSVQGALL